MPGSVRLADSMEPIAWESARSASKRILPSQATCKAVRGRQDRFPESSYSMVGGETTRFSGPFEGEWARGPDAQSGLSCPVLREICPIGEGMRPVMGGTKHETGYILEGRQAVWAHKSCRVYCYYSPQLNQPAKEGSAE
jgi:hypothetical protein